MVTLVMLVIQVTLNPGNAGIPGNAGSPGNVGNLGNTGNPGNARKI